MAVIYKREHDDDSKDKQALMTLLIALALLVVSGLCLGATLYFLHRYKKQRKTGDGQSSKNKRGLTIAAIPFGRDKSHIDSEKRNLIDNSSPMPLTPDSIPEIRITFPEEEDAHGRRKSGRVVIVEVGEAGAAFVRPVPEESLPPYQQHDGFSSIDIEKIGGLKEKDHGRWV